jgi:hypothetical protein
MKRLFNTLAAAMGADLFISLNICCLENTGSNKKMTKKIGKCLLGLFFNGVFLLITTGLSHSATLQVPAEYPTIQAGINAAVNGDVVLVASGTYTGTGNKDIDFLGKVITVQSNSGPNNTVIDCQGAGRGILFHSGEGATSRFVGFTIKNGHVTDSSPYGGKGGGIHCYNSSPTILNCVVAKCTADGFGGGGVFLNISSARIENSIVEYNLTETTGGGILIVDSSPTIYNCIIRYNKTSGYSSGGGVCVIRSHPTLSYCTITYNEANINYSKIDPLKATNSGGISFRDKSTGILDSSIISYNKAQERGGIGSWDASPKITNCLIENNEATVHGGGGVGFYSNSDATVSKSTIKNNTAKEYGGGVSVWNETASSSGPVFTDSVIENNNAGDSGGGLYFLDSSTEVSRCIIRGNESPKRAGIGLKAINGTTSSILVNDLVYDNTATSFGGGVTCFSGADATITNCTVVNNHSGIGNAGLYLDNADAWVANSIFWGNLPADSPITGAVITYSDISGGTGSNINAVPSFLSSTDFHLKNGSPCIDKGDNYASFLPSVDLGGNQRISGTAVDMGAYEFPFISGGPGASGTIGAAIVSVNPPVGPHDIIPILLLLLHTP